MAFVCFCKDVSGSAEMRRANTPQHLAYIESIMDKVLVAGPLAGESTAEYTASCFVYDTDDQEEALSLLHNDPYYKAGIYSEITCQRFVPAAGSWIGGKIW